MRKLVTIVCLCMFVLPMAGFTEDEGKSNPLQPLARLIGSWQGEMTLQDGSSFTVGVEFEWGLNQKVIRYSIHTLNGQEKQAYGEGTYWWNPQSKALEFREYNAYGSAVNGTIRPQGEDLLAEWTEVTPSGGTNHYKDTIRFPSPDSWSSLPYQKQDGGWEKVMESMTYHRR